MNFDLNKLTTEVRSEIDNLKVQEDWTTAEVIEEALRAYFRVINAEEPDDCAPQVVPLRLIQRPSQAAPSKAKRRSTAALPQHEFIDRSQVEWLPSVGISRHTPPEYIRHGALIEEHFPGVNAPSLKTLATEVPPGKCVVVCATESGKRFTRHPEQWFWQLLP